jgi:hypothetical protein
MQAKRTKPRQGGQPGNQNARRHGYYSAINPPSYDQLIIAAKDAIKARDPEALDAIARAHGHAGRRADARYTRDLAKVLRITLGAMAALSPQGGGDAGTQDPP